jgi:hypothetical protein
MTMVVSGSSCPAVAKTWSHAARAEGSEKACAMPIPQDLSTMVENLQGRVFRNDPRAKARSQGGSGADVSTVVFHTSPDGPGLGTLSLVKGRALRESADRILVDAAPTPALARVRAHGQGQADISTEQPPPREDPWLPRPDANAGGTGDPRFETSQEPPPPDGLSTRKSRAGARRTTGSSTRTESAWQAGGNVPRARIRRCRGGRLPTSGWRRRPEPGSTHPQGRMARGRAARGEHT